MRNDAIKQADVGQCEAGNITGVHPLPVYQKIRNEILSENDNSKLPIEDLLSELHIEKEKNLRYLQKIDLHPFSIITCMEKNLNIIHNLMRKGETVQLHLDATGGILRKITDRPLLQHTLVIAVKSNHVNSRHTVLNLAELITVDNCSFNIEYFLRLIRNKFIYVSKENKLADIFVTDKSMANINAIISSQNNLTLKQYLIKTYEIIEGRDAIGDLTLALLCSSHMSKNWKADIQKFYPELEKPQLLFLYSLIGHLMNIHDWKTLKIYIELLIELFCHPMIDKRYKEIFRELKLYTTDANANADADASDDEVVENGYTMTLMDEVDQSKSIYRNSPFYTLFYSSLKKKIEKMTNEKEATNPYFCIEYAKDFLKKHISFLPLWSAVLPSINLAKTEKYKRPNNGCIEGFFGNIKNSIRLNKEIGKLGNIKIGRYVRFMRDKVITDAKEIQLKIPDRHISRKPNSSKSKEPSQSTVCAEREMWKGKSSQKSTIMFNQTTLHRYLGGEDLKKSVFNNRLFSLFNTFNFITDLSAE